MTLLSDHFLFIRYYLYDIILLIFQLRWDMQRSFSDPGTSDILPGANPLIFNDGVTSQFIEIYVKADDVPEVEEVFKIVLKSVDNGGEISAQKNQTTFTIK